MVQRFKTYVNDLNRTVHTPFRDKPAGPRPSGRSPWPCVPPKAKKDRRASARLHSRPPAPTPWGDPARPPFSGEGDPTHFRSCPCRRDKLHSVGRPHNLSGPRRSRARVRRRPGSLSARPVRLYHSLLEAVPQAVEEIAAGLRALGMAKGDVVALNSETRLEFYLADLGIMANGSIAAALYPSYPAPGPAAHARARRRRAPSSSKIRRPWRRCAPRRVEHWILLTGEAEGALTLDALRAIGREALARDPELPARLRSEVSPSDPAILYLTSGATGEPKMALVTHQAIVSNIDMGPAVLPIGPEDSTVAFLPSAHIAQRVVIELLPIRMGMPVTFFESLMKLPQDIRKVRPTLLLAPPRMWERIYSTICTELRKRPAPARKAFYSGLALALGGRPLPARRQERSVAHPRPAEDRRPPDVPQGPRALRRQAARGGLRSRAAQQGPGGVLRSRRHAHHRRLRPHRRRRGVPQSARSSQAGQHRQGRCPASRCGSLPTARCW